MQTKIPNARRDPVSGAVIFTDTRAYAAAKVRQARSKQILENENEVVTLRSQVNKLTKLVERLLETSGRQS